MAGVLRVGCSEEDLVSDGQRRGLVGTVADQIPGRFVRQPDEHQGPIRACEDDTALRAGSLGSRASIQEDEDDQHLQ